EAGWAVVDPVLDVWKALPPRNFPNYAAGSWGPREADEIINRDGRFWRKISPSREHKGLDEILGLFLSNRNITPTTACFGIAGPVVQGRANVSNLAWTVDAIALAKLLGIETVWLINDLVAHASGITALAQEDFVVLNAGSAVPGNAALVSAGTGLGEA